MVGPGKATELAIGALAGSLAASAPDSSPCTGAPARDLIRSVLSPVES
jgi:hypothetical protein